VTGEPTTAAVGAVICGFATLPHVEDGWTVKVRVCEVSASQALPPWATTYQVLTPLPTLRVIDVSAVAPARVVVPSVVIQTA
jgi:hypothetical protein